jgi:phosphatidylserine/phosphatidylglycerophosphate/cardiolipin synthase-like enzyme
MTGLVITFALLFWCSSAWAYAVWPLWSTPENPRYLQTIPQFLARAEEEVLVALSDLRSYADGTTAPLIAGLTQAAQRGGNVQVLVEKGGRELWPEQERALAELRQAGVHVREDSPEVTLHAAFLVIDRRWVIVGSTHWTKTALTASYQMDLVLEEPSLAALFRTFFFYLWEGKTRTKTRIPTGAWPEPALLPLLDFPESKNHFLAAQAVLAQAQSEILLLLHQLAFYPEYPESPSTLLLRALADAARRGLRVRVLLEGGERDRTLAEANRLSAAWLSAQGVEVRFDPLPSLMHAKCLIVDGQHVLVSSANWNYPSLVKNVEAGVLLLGTPTLARLLGRWFTQLWEASSPVR